MDYSMNVTKNIALTGIGQAAAWALFISAAAVIFLGFVATAIGITAMIMTMILRERMGRKWLWVYAASWVVAVAGLWPLMGIAVN